MCVQCVEKETLLAMRKKATELGLHGACVVLTADKDGTSRWDPIVGVAGDRFVDPPEATSEWSPTGATYWGIAMSKIAEMLETSKSSGTIEGRNPRKGEFGYKGGITWERNGLRAYLAFSGGTEDEDLLVVEAGRFCMNEGFDRILHERRVAVTILEALLDIEGIPEQAPRRSRRSRSGCDD